MSSPKEHNCKDSGVKAWVSRHVQPERYAVLYSNIDPEKGPKQADDIINKTIQDLKEIPQDKRTKLYFTTSRLPRAVQTSQLVLEGISKWIKQVGLSNISIEGFEIWDFLQTTDGPQGLIEEPKWLPKVKDIDDRRARAYRSWLLAVREARLQEWGLETPSEVESNSVLNFRDVFQNVTPEEKVIFIGSSHEPFHGSLLKRHTRNQIDLAIKYGERIKACLVSNGVFLHWRNKQAMFTGWDDVLGAVSATDKEDMTA